MNEKTSEPVSMGYSTGILGQIDIESIEASLGKITEFKHMALRQLKKGVDYGAVPGSDKPTLLKPGAEKLLSCLELTSTFDIVDSYHDIEKEVFSYTVRCSILRGTKLITQGMGCCSSSEMKSDGQNGAKGRDKEPPIGAVENFCLKIAKKRALIDACLTATAMSETFTQDMEEVKAPVSGSEESTQIHETTAGSVPASDGDGFKNVYDTQINFGRHKGQTLGEIYMKHPDYVVWLAQNAMDDEIREAASFMVSEINQKQAQV